MKSHAGRGRESRSQALLGRQAQGAETTTRMTRTGHHGDGKYVQPRAGNCPQPVWGQWGIKPRQLEGRREPGTIFFAM